METVYVVSFQIECKGYHPRIIQGLYFPKALQTEAEARVDVYMAIHKQVAAEAKTDKFKMKIVEYRKIPVDFIYNPGVRGKTSGNTDRR